MTDTTFNLSESAQRRLGRMVEVLQKVQEREAKFDIEHWGGPTKIHPKLIELLAEEGPYRSVPLPEENLSLMADCGTTCCAVGWGLFDPELRGEGLKAGVWKSFSGAPRLEPRFGELEGLDAVGKFFEIDIITATRLFGGEYAVAEEKKRSTTPADVIGAIQHTLLTGKAPVWACHDINEEREIAKEMDITLYDEELGITR